MSDVATVVSQLKQDLIASIDQLLINLPAYPGAKATLRVQTLGGFHVSCDDVEVLSTAWGREKALHLFQFFITMHHQYLHKEQIIDRLWPELDMEKGDRDFKVALNSINKALEPTREPRHEPRFTLRYGLAYGLDFANVWLDTEVLEQLITVANQALLERSGQLDAAQNHAIACYTAAVNLYNGDYLPERRYEDWSSAERERLQLLALNTMTRLAELLLERSPLESVRLTQRVLAIDPVWEDAYRIQMRSYMVQRNRPLAIRTYEKCRKVLDEEFGVDPLPETTALYQQVIKAR
ncbi:hypothetical protein BH10CHL1_BH10CHL1_17640 [soil metagenome]